MSADEKQERDLEQQEEESAASPVSENEERTAALERHFLDYLRMPGVWSASKDNQFEIPIAFRKLHRSFHPRLNSAVKAAGK